MSSDLGPYRLGDRIGGSVWRAEDTRSGKPIALKVLTKQLPKDQAKREALVREVRVAAALYHPFLVPILEIVPLDENLAMAMALVNAVPFTRRLNGAPLQRADFFKLAYQLVDAVHFLHTKNVVHGNINADSVLVTADGQVKLGGLNLTNLIPRPDKISGGYQQKGSDIHCVAYMAPEQITGQTIDSRTDVFSLGVVMYELATGKLPYQADNAPELARKIVEGQPQSPKALNPAIDSTVLSILGRCLFKDQFKRHKDARAILDEIAKAEPAAAKFAADLTSRSASTAAAADPTVRRPVKAAAPEAAKPVSEVTQPGVAVASAAPASAGADAAARQAIMLIGDVDGYEQLLAADAEGARNTVARVQQILGESIYLFDGQIVDPFAPVVIGEMPSVDNALEAARKGEFDFSPEQQGAKPIPVRLLLHAGNVMTRDGTVVGDAVTKAKAIMQQLPAGELYLSEEFVRKARGSVRVRDAGAKAGTKLYTIMPAEPKEVHVSTAELAEQAIAESEAEAAAAEQAAVASASRKRSMMFAAIAAVLAIVVLGGGALLFIKSRGAKPAATTTVAAEKPAAAPEQASVMVNPLNVEGTDATLADRANAIRLATIDILKTMPNVRVSDTAGPNVVAYAGTLRTGAAGPEMVAAAPGAPPTPVPDAASGIMAVLGWISAKANVPVRGLTHSADALNAYAAAVTAVAAKDDAKAEASLRASVTADPAFLPAELLAMKYFTARGNAAEALNASRQVMALDPSNIDAPRNVAHLALETGDVQNAFAAFGSILKKDPSDIQALTLIGRYAASVGDDKRFHAALARMKNIPPNLIPIHEPDLLVAAGGMQKAIDQYYEIESNVPNNAALSLKIGRISVLRQSLPIAQLELGKLQQSDPMYGYHILKAYIAAHERARSEVESELKAAFEASTPGDDYWTSAADIYALFGETTTVVEALKKAAARKEPTAGYILTNPLFGYLQNDAEYQAVRASLAAQQDEIRAALPQTGI